MATTVRVEVAPAAIEVGLAVMVTAVVSGTPFPLNNAHPVKKVLRRPIELASMMREPTHGLQVVCKSHPFSVNSRNAVEVFGGTRGTSKAVADQVAALRHLLSHRRHAQSDNR